MRISAKMTATSSTKTRNQPVTLCHCRRRCCFRHHKQQYEYEKNRAKKKQKRKMNDTLFGTFRNSN